MDGERESESDGAARQHAEGERSDAHPIDVVAVAERVYRLMREEVRLERARGATLFGGRT